MRKRKPCRRRIGNLPRNIVCKPVGKLSSAVATCIGEDSAGLGAKPANVVRQLLVQGVLFRSRDSLRCCAYAVFALLGFSLAKID